MTDNGIPGGSIAYVARRRDPWRAAAARLFPEPRAARYLVLIAFRSELLRISSLAKEPMVGRIRLAWWRETLLENGGKPVGDPLADAVAALVAKNRAATDDLKAFLEAVERLDFPDVSRIPASEGDDVQDEAKTFAALCARELIISDDFDVLLASAGAVGWFWHLALAPNTRLHTLDEARSSANASLRRLDRRTATAAFPLFAHAALWRSLRIGRRPEDGRLTASEATRLSFAALRGQI
jgi:hypothetical protein